MLTDRDRALLAPHLARLQRARADLAAAEQAAEAAERRLAESTIGTGILDRWLSGQFSRTPPAARAYHEARRARAGAVAAVDGAKTRITLVHQELHLLIEPMMPRLDPGYDRLVTAVACCDRALAECRAMQNRLAEATTAIRAATRENSPRRVVGAALRNYKEATAQARNHAPALQQALDTAAVAARARRVGWDATSLAGLPRAAGDVVSLERLRRSRTTVQTLQRHLSHVIVTVSTWRREADAARDRAVRAARLHLTGPCGQSLP
nr:hypothetical protein [uncultured Actinoplanes sp.]